MSSDKDSRSKRIILLASANVLALFIVGFLLFRVTVLEIVGLNILQSMGFEQANFSVKEFSSNEIRITDLSLDDRFEVENVSVGYSLDSLLDGTANWISVSGLTVDVSDPEEGALKTIADLTRSEGHPSEPSAQKIPSISITRGTVFGMFDKRKFQSKISLELTPELIASGKIQVSGAIETDSGPVLIDDLELVFKGDAAEQSGRGEIKSGVIRHGVDLPDWAPLSITGHAQIKDQKLDFISQIGLGTDTPLFRLEGFHYLAEFKGSMDVDIHDITFDKAGLQPASLSSKLKFIPPIDTLLSSQSKVTWNADKIQADSIIFAKDTQIIGPDYSVDSSLINVAIKAWYDLKSGEHRLDVGTEDLTALVTQGGQKYSIDDLKADLQIEETGAKLALKGFSLSVRHVSQTPDFAPLLISLQADTFGGDVSFAGEIKDEQGRLSIPFDGQHGLENGIGMIKGVLSHQKFTRKGLQPKDLSARFGDIDGKVSGKVDASVNAQWSPEKGFSVTQLIGDVKEGGYRKKGIDLRKLDIHFEAKDIAPEKAFGLRLSKMNAWLRVDGKESALVNAEASVDIHENWQDLDFKLTKARIFPGKGMVVKPVIDLVASSQLIGDKVTFMGNAKTDFLGDFVSWAGHHNLKNGKGDVAVEVSPIEFEEDGVQPSDLITIADPTLILSGAVSTDITANWSDKGVKTSAKIVLDHLDLKNDSVAVTGLMGQVLIDELQPLTISKTQEIYADKIIAAVALNQPVMRFRLASRKGEPLLYLDEVNMGVVGGKAVIKDAVLDIGAGVNQINVQLSNIDLEEVMALSDVEDFTASGTLNGQIPVVFDGEKLVIDTGLLETEGPGILQLKSEKARQALAGGGDQTELLFDILENFQYSELSVRIKKLPSGEDTVLLHTKGSNPNVENSRPVILNINLSTNLDKIFNTLLDGYRLSEKALRATVRGNKK